MEEWLQSIANHVQDIYRDAIDPIEDKFAFERRPSKGEIGGAPMVLFLGNHSSGKSTFINHLLGQEIQKTGLAPTDDSFSIIRYGKTEEERDGNAVANNPDLPYDSLKHFGPEFLSHFRLRERPIELLKSVTLVDTPGMIDSATEESGRGYDFAGVARWFAERADVVLVFFDPDKPGTTGETLQVFTESLRGIDHKLRIVMNKMDQFRSLPDFARAYGALCWNLGKVIPRKDLPHIFTTFIPVEGAPQAVLPVEDFEKAREELIDEVKRAPARRVDNMLTQVQDHAERLRVHARVIDTAARKLRKFRMRLWTFIAIAILIGVFAGIVSIALEATWLAPTVIFIVTALIGYGGYYAIRGLVKAEEKQIIAGLSTCFEELYARELIVRDRSEDIRALWEVVHPRTKHTVEKLGLMTFPRLRAGTLKPLDKVLEKVIPDLRSKLHKNMRTPAPAQS